jgi:hypothetical protein
MDRNVVQIANEWGHGTSESLWLVRQVSTRSGALTSSGDLSERKGYGHEHHEKSGAANYHEPRRR